MDWKSKSGRSIISDAIVIQGLNKDQKRSTILPILTNDSMDIKWCKAVENTGIGDEFLRRQSVRTRINRNRNKEV